MTTGQLCLRAAVLGFIVGCIIPVAPFIYSACVK